MTTNTNGSIVAVVVNIFVTVSKEYEHLLFVESEDESKNLISITSERKRKIAKA
jgi:hypothetical protein